MNKRPMLAVAEDSPLGHATTLERRWAQLFEALEWPARYKPFAVEGFAPTFVLDLKWPIAVFVANVVDVAEYRTVARAAERAGYWHNEILVVGAELSAGKFTLDDGSFMGVPIGQLGELDLENEPKKGAKPSYWWSGGAVFACSGCGGYGLAHANGSYHCRVCGAHDGDHHLGYIGYTDLPELARFAFPNSPLKAERRM